MLLAKCPTSIGFLVNGYEFYLPNNNWRVVLEKLLKKYSSIADLLIEEKANREVVYPRRKKILNAFHLTDFDDVKVVIVLQDPYPENYAQGLALSVKKEVIPPGSVVNFFKEIEKDLKIEMNYDNGDLSYLAKQGVLLLNTTLTAREGIFNSHSDSDWKLLIRDIISEISKKKNNIVFFLLGTDARDYLGPYIKNRNNHKIIVRPHFSQLAYWRWKLDLGNRKTFTKINKYLELHGILAIDWSNLD